MNKYTKANIKAIISILIIVTLLILLAISVTGNLNQDRKINAYLVEISTPSPIEKIEANVESLKADVVNFTNARDDSQAIADEKQSMADAYEHNRKTAIWATRCWENNAILLMQDKELDECTDNLERFAFYNLGK